MKSFLGLVGVAVVIGSIGCGTTVNVIGGDDGSGGQGEGGAGSGEGAQGPGPSSTSSGPQPPPPNPEGCPASSPEYYGECPTSDLACAYLEEAGCTVSYTCVYTQDCYEGTSVSGTGGYDGGYGGYGDCYAYNYWQPTTASCAPSEVECGAAQNGDVCALPGEYCSGGGECSYEDKWCGEDHRWVVSSYDDDCCYDDCCYDDCYCEPYYCPEYLPQPGEYCDPCYDSDSCSYEIPDEYCGYVYASATCNPSTYTWDVYTEGCTGTTAAVGSSGSGSSGSGSSGSGGAFPE